MIDLHMHSIYSDGTDDLDTLVDKWIDAKITHVAITDHDTISGVQNLLKDMSLMEKIKNNGIKFIPGIEFAGIIDDHKIHLLGYNMDISSEHFQNILNIGKQKRLYKFEARLQALKEKFNVEYSEESLKALRTDGCFLGKPIMVNYMLEDGICDTRKQGFDMLHNLTNPMSTRVDAKLIIPAVVKSNGICVWAHPLGGIGEPRNSYDKVEEILQKLIPLGLKGLECYYSLYTNEEINKLLEIAEKYNLKVSAGSDYHGKNKTVRIGELSCDTNIILDKNDVTILEFL